MPILGAWQLSDLAIAGPDPFGSAEAPACAAVGATRLTLAESARAEALRLGEADAPPETPHPLYSYTLRPAGATGPMGDVTLLVLGREGGVCAIACATHLFAGRSYDIIAIAQDTGAIPMPELAICFAAGSLIATKQGPVPVERLRAGMRVQTMDNGYQPLKWAGRWLVNGRGANAPVRFETGVLGNARPLFLSGQHRVLLRPERGPLRGEEVLVAARALIGQPGISRAPCDRIQWVHLLFDNHEVVFAEDARAESLLPGPSAFSAVSPETARFLEETREADPLYMMPARPIVPLEKAQRMLRLRQKA